MHEDNYELLDIVGQVYDSALNPSLWPEVLGAVGRFLETSQTALVLENAVDPSQSVFYTSFPDREWTERYIQSFMLINPMRLATVHSTGAGDIILTTDFMTPAEYGRTPFSTEFLAPRGVVDIAVAVLDKTATTISVLSGHRSVDQGFADEMLRNKIRLLFPHVQRAVKISELFDRRTVQAEALIETLNSVAGAVFLVDEAGTILHANTRAHRMLDDADVVRVRANRLVLLDRVAGQALSLALSEAERGEAPSAGAGNGTPLRGVSGRHYVASFIPLTQGRRAPIASAYRAVAAICIKAWQVEMAGVPTLASRFDLTRREAAILVAAVEIGGVAEIAAAMGLSAATVKTHLKSIYRKTGVSRHGDLVKLVAAAEMPLR